MKVKVPDGYRVLRTGETPQAGDYGWSCNAEWWAPASTLKSNTVFIRLIHPPTSDGERIKFKRAVERPLTWRADKLAKKVEQLWKTARTGVAPRMRPEDYRELQVGEVTQEGDIVYKEGSWQDTVNENVDGFYTYLRPVDEERHSQRPVQVSKSDFDEFF
jgi:hypothetical protein